MVDFRKELGAHMDILLYLKKTKKVFVKNLTLELKSETDGVKTLYPRRTVDYTGFLKVKSIDIINETITIFDDCYEPKTLLLKDYLNTWRLDEE